MERWKTLSKETILNHSKYLAVEDHTVLLPDGRVIRNWPWVITPDYINVVAVTESGEFLCFRQVKYAVEGTSLAPVGGYLEPGEDPLTAARRELLEETGFEADEWTSLGTFSVGANRGFSTAYFYLALNVRRVAAPDADDLEEQELLILSRDEMEAALDAGEFKVLPWTTIVALAFRELDRRKREE
jgi:ADP-ribose pyrophosphatase